MDKEYMLLMVNKRLEELAEAYKQNVSGHSNATTQSSASCLRSRIKRDICILELVKELLLTSKAVYIENEDACLGFDKLLKK